MEKLHVGRMGGAGGVAVDLTRCLKFLPTFDHNEVDQYFTCFQRVANDFALPKEKWALLLRSVIGMAQGKARDFIASMPEDQLNNFEYIKEHILLIHEKIPEAYHRSFRNLKKEAAQTHLDFLRMKEKELERWLR